MKASAFCGALLYALVAIVLPFHSHAQFASLNVPAGSERFGTTITTLPNGNAVITDPYFDLPGPVVDVGAVYLYNGATGQMISMITGSTADDRIGAQIIVLPSGNFVILSPNWDNGAATNAGAVTWANGSTGVSGQISASNSLVGSKADDGVGASGIRVLANGNYVVRSPNWDNGAVVNAGAVTWASGTAGRWGTISSSNSLIGTTANDSVGSGGVAALTNGHYVVRTSGWDNGTIVDAGAVTWANGTSGRVGTISSSNSLVGSKESDFVGVYGVAVLPNGNYVVRSAAWDNGTIVDAGAVTWANGATGRTGVVTSSNSLVGTAAGDFVGGSGVTVLTNGNYVVRSADWDNAGIADAGAVTWGNGTSGTTGAVSALNSLVGSTASDFVGSTGVVALTNGNYVVQSANWDNLTATNAGAATWGNGNGGTVGVITALNSLVGTKAGDFVGGYGVTALTNGNYVVTSSSWDNGAAADAGAVTWGNGTSGVKGAVSTSNSLVGSTAGDFAGAYGVTALTNGNYVVSSAAWDRGSNADAGAVTFGNGTTGITGAITTTNSLVGSVAGDLVGNGGAMALTNGNYVVGSPDWDRGATIDAGAATFGNGVSGVKGSVSTTNSLVGSTPGDYVAAYGIEPLANGNYVVVSSDWDNGTLNDAGAVTFADGNTGLAGSINSANSLIGAVTRDLVGSGGVVGLSNGNYVVKSPSVDNAGIIDAGAISYMSGATGNFAPADDFADEKSAGTLDGLTIDSVNSVLGGAAGQGTSMTYDYDTVNQKLVVGRPYDNTVVFFQRFSPTSATVSVEGRVLNAFGGGIRATIEIAASSGDTVTVRSNQMGYYRVEGLPAGDTYIFTVTSKEHFFAPVVMQVAEDLQGVDFTAQ